MFSFRCRIYYCLFYLIHPNFKLLFFSSFFSCHYYYQTSITHNLQICIRGAQMFVKNYEFYLKLFVLLQQCEVFKQHKNLSFNPKYSFKYLHCDFIILSKRFIFVLFSWNNFYIRLFSKFMIGIAIFKLINNFYIKISFKISKTC